MGASWELNEIVFLNCLWYHKPPNGKYYSYCVRDDFIFTYIQTPSIHSFILATLTETLLNSRHWDT